MINNIMTKSDKNDSKTIEKSGMIISSFLQISDPDSKKVVLTKRDS